MEEIINTNINNIDPSNLDLKTCFIISLRGLRNGIYYGGKIRLVHSLVMTILFKQGTLYDKIKSILELTYEHAKNLGLFAFIYKFSLCLLRKYFKQNHHIFPFISGLIGSYFMWSKKNPVNMQIMLYLFSRNILAVSNKINDKYFEGKYDLFGLSSMLVWGVVMYLFESSSQDLQSSLKSSMDFIYKDSDKWNSWVDFVPVYIPQNIVNVINKVIK